SDGEDLPRLKPSCSREPGRSDCCGLSTPHGGIRRRQTTQRYKRTCCFNISVFHGSPITRRAAATVAGASSQEYWSSASKIQKKAEHTDLLWYTPGSI
ncbi:hypothetical protein NDU88_006913, partial [Pleurodeles waltl]